MGGGDEGERGSGEWRGAACERRRAQNTARASSVRAGPRFEKDVCIVGCEPCPIDPRVPSCHRVRV